MKPLSPNTEKLYRGALVRGFGGVDRVSAATLASDVHGWTESNRALLRAAARRTLVERSASPEELKELMEQIPIKWAPRRVTEVPTEDEVQAYEAAAQALPPGRRAMALLPLAMGLRANEAVTLTRKSVERAAKFGELVVLRKGGHEQLLPAHHAVGLFQELLQVNALRRVGRFVAATAGGRAWKETREVLSTAQQPIGAYHILHRVVRECGDRAGVKSLRPHKLRHAFATRMSRDGAPLPVIQWALGHANIATTMIYVHPSAQDAQKYMRSFE